MVGAGDRPDHPAGRPFNSVRHRVRSGHRHAAGGDTWKVVVMIPARRYADDATSILPYRKIPPPNLLMVSLARMPVVDRLQNPRPVLGAETVIILQR